MNKEQLRGYLLEEALAYLIQSSGYRLITKTQGEIGLRNSGSGLQIRGRGAWHQADVLGRLKIIPAFTYPLRLFTEAKYHDSQPVSVGIVRNAVGTITDLNGKSIIFKNSLPVSFNYRYEYALFSASGFSKEAVEMALVYGIALIDLNTDEYKTLLKSIKETAEEVTKSMSRSGLVKEVRKVMREKLKTSEHQDKNTENNGSEWSHELRHKLADLIKTINNFEKLYIGTVNAPFILLLKANSSEAFEEYALSKEGEDQYVELHWNRADESGFNCSIYPVEKTDAYTLSFKVPHALHKWFFKQKPQKKSKALQDKNSFVSEICIYLSGRGVDKVIKLKLNPYLFGI